MIIQHISEGKRVALYENVEYVNRDSGDTVHLRGENKAGKQLYNDYFIACIHLAEGASLERVDVPRD
jgi:hypothetical protein